MYELHIAKFQAVNYGMPHIHAKYRGQGINATCFDDDWVPCAVCGRTANNVHHNPPRSVSRAKGDDGVTKNGWLRLETGYGKFDLKPALIALCGSGTTGCHGRVHNGEVTIQWTFDEEEYEERWLDGWYLAHGIDGYIPTRDGMFTTRVLYPHSPELYRIGRWVITDKVKGTSYEYRGEW